MGAIYYRKRCRRKRSGQESVFSAVQGKYYRKESCLKQREELFTPALFGIAQEDPEKCFDTYTYGFCNDLYICRKAGFSYIYRIPVITVHDTFIIFCRSMKALLFAPGR